MGQHTVVFDLETVPDTTVWTPPAAEPVDTSKCEKCGGAITTPVGSDGMSAQKCPTMSRGKCRPPKPAIVKDVFPPAHAHRVVCAGYAVLENDIPTLVAAVSDDQAGGEAALVEGLGTVLGQADTLVTWAGLRFDLPVLQLRSIRHGLAQPWAARAQARFEGAHVDLADVLTLRGLSGDRLHLDEAARLIGLPGKDGVDGAQVGALVAAGDLEAVRAYCSRDVVQTTYLYLRYRLLRGELSRAAYTAACRAMRSLWRGRAGFEQWIVDYTVLELGEPDAVAA